MRSKTKILLCGGLLAASLMTSALPAAAQDYWHWQVGDQRWERRADIHSDDGDLTQARLQLEYDRLHRASRRRIAQDEARLKDIELNVRDRPNDSRGNWD